ERVKLQTVLSQPRPDLLTSIAEDVSLLPPDILDDAAKKPSINLALSQSLAEATPQQVTQLITDLAPEMKNRRNRPSAFLRIDLPDFIEARGIVSLGEGGQLPRVPPSRSRRGDVARLRPSGDARLRALHRGSSLQRRPDSLSPLRARSLPKEQKAGRSRSL